MVEDEDRGLLVGTIASAAFIFCLCSQERSSIPNSVNADSVKFDVTCAHSRLLSYWWLSYVVVVSYFASLWLGVRYMRRRVAPFKLPVGVVVTWNSLLAGFSLLGTLFTLPPFLLAISRNGWEKLLCHDDVFDTLGNDGPWAFWAFAFICSKFPELLDTALIVLKRKNISCLHCYHHASVLLYAWHAFLWRMPTGLVFISMNYLTHSVMYVYYARSAYLDRRLRWASCVTLLQILQMVAGICVTYKHLLLLSAKSCESDVSHVEVRASSLKRALYAAGLMYASYLLLFLRFYTYRYICSAIEGRRQRAHQL